MNNVLPNGTYIEFDLDDFIDGDSMPEMPQNDRMNNVGSES
jgi:hypothetical protein